MKLIHTAAELAAFAAEMGVRPDWHEPDEQELTARVEGGNFDNAGFWPRDDTDVPARHVELHVIFSTTVYDSATGDLLPGRDLAAVNLASLCAWATEAGQRQT